MQNNTTMKPLKQNKMIEVTFNYKGEVRIETLKNSTISKAYDYVVNKYVGSKIKSIVWL